mgnify:CR=1 FL=1
MLFRSGDVFWFDVVIPRGHARWDDDVSRAAWWLGDAVRTTLGGTGLEVHRGAMRTTPWSRQVCFAGLGPGELTRSGRKVLGLSQRRTKSWIRYQCAIYRRWDPAALLGLLAPPAPSVDELESLVDVGSQSLDELLNALR